MHFFNSRKLITYSKEAPTQYATPDAEITYFNLHNLF